MENVMQQYFEDIQLRSEDIGSISIETYLHKLTEIITKVIEFIASPTFEMMSEGQQFLDLIVKYINVNLQTLNKVKAMQPLVVNFCNDILDMTQIFPYFQSENTSFRAARASMIFLHKRLFGMVKAFILKQEHHIHTAVFVRSFNSVVKYINTQPKYKDTFYDHVLYKLNPTCGRKHLPTPLLRALLKTVPPNLLDNYHKEHNQHVKRKIEYVYREVENSRLFELAGEIAGAAADNFNIKLFNNIMVNNHSYFNIVILV